MKSTLVILLFVFVLSSTSAFLPSPVGIFTHGFRSLAEAKMATAGKIVSYITGDRPVKASVALAVGDKPQEAEVIDDVQPAVESQVEVPVGEAVDVTQTSQVPPVDLEAAMYAIKLDEQLHKAYPQVQPPQGAIPLNMQEFQDIVPAGTTGGKFVGVSMIPQTVHQVPFQYQVWQPVQQAPTFSAVQPGSVEAEQKTFSESAAVQTSSLVPSQTYGHPSGLYQWSIPQKGWVSNEPVKAEMPVDLQQRQAQLWDPAALQTSSVAAGQAVIYPYGPVKIPAYPSGSYMVQPVPVDATYPTSDQVPVPTHQAGPMPQAPALVLQPSEPIIPGSQLPETVQDPLAAASEEVAVEVPTTSTEGLAAQESSAVASTASPEGNGTTGEETVRSRKARSTEESGEPGRRVRLSDDDVEAYFRFIQEYDDNQCMARLICEVAHSPQEFGAYGRQIDHFFREYEPVKSQSAAFYYKTASEQGLSSEDADDCAVKYKGCALDTAQLRSLAPIEA